MPHAAGIGLVPAGLHSPCSFLWYFDWILKTSGSQSFRAFWVPVQWLENSVSSVTSFWILIKANTREAFPLVGLRMGLKEALRVRSFGDSWEEPKPITPYLPARKNMSEV